MYNFSVEISDKIALGFEEKLIDITNGRAIIKKSDNGKFVDVN